MTNPVSGGFQFTPPDGMNNAASYPTTPANETAARQMWMDFYWQLMNEMNKPTLSAAAYAQYNRLINGNFAVNQLGLSGTVTIAAGQYGHDMWKAGAAGCTYTFATVNNITTITITAGSLVQVIEGINLASSTYTLSWVGTAQAKIAGGAYGNSGMTAPITGGVNLQIEFNVGTLSKVQFNAGDQALPFQPRSYPDELALCQRYFRYLADSSVPFRVGYVVTQYPILFSIPFNPEMRTTPTTVGLNTTTGAIIALTSLLKGTHYDYIQDDAAATNDNANWAEFSAYAQDLKTKRNYQLRAHRTAGTAVTVDWSMKSGFALCADARL